MRRLFVASLLALSLSVLGLGAWPAVSAAADVSPAPILSVPDADPVLRGDPRSEGEGPGIVGSPLAILLGVILLGLVTAGVTIAVVRLHGNDT